MLFTRKKNRADNQYYGILNYISSPISKRHRIKGSKMVIKLTVSYDGTDFSGWQKQNDLITVQGVVEDALTKITGEKTSVVGSGRTDAGVHAEGQVASFKTRSEIPPERFAVALNTALPFGVKALKSELADDDFNARRNAKLKTYRYSIYNSDIEEPLKERYKSRVYGKLDEETMREAAKIFVGEHDFKAYAASGYSAKTTVRTIYSLDVIHDGENYDFVVTGSGFLYNMVRIIAGTLIAAGSGKITLKDVSNALISGKRHKDIKTMPAKGLCLVKVKY